MQFKVFHIDVSGNTDAEEEMNLFLRTHRVVTVHRELAKTISGTYWCFCIEYLDKLQPNSVTPSSSFSSKKTERIDYKEVLSDSDFAVFNKIRELRKELAVAESIPVYTVCTNEHLSQMVLKRCTTLSALQQIPGFGEAKIQKYGKQFLEILTVSFKMEKQNETSGTTDGTNPHAG